MTEGKAARWYVVQVFSRAAEAELAKRRFGIFVPALAEKVVSRGRLVIRHTPIVPGYVFVFFWETDANWIRVMTTPAVERIIGWVTDEQIDRLRWEESCEQVDVEVRREHALKVVRSARRRPGRLKRKRGKIKRCGKANGAA
ncbi:MAG: transcription termination/antitermination NusG family protein [Bradyrhizobium sp.]|uniref:transcription termination/antitermination protein NusG n=1 Tax=Bradyrhizobium sp. TaxID=376 RepID=UPI0029A61F0F|nr:transcription termination/antitermination NusG family protein [Bradyrhizobium sp.]MDX3971146.1 transcription termination/antitermination NusG family protein [Bradyrhizobium sp.]